MRKRGYEHVCLASGGVDSTYLLAHAIRPSEIGDRKLALFVDYGQPSVEVEERAVCVLAKACLWDFGIVRVKGMPLGQMEDGIGPQVVPARNLWLISLAAAFGKRVWIGCAPQDEADYADCRYPFLASMRETVRSIGVDLQWSTASRADRISLLEERELLPFTWSCYGPGPNPCGECNSCRQ